MLARVRRDGCLCLVFHAVCAGQSCFHAARGGTGERLAESPHGIPFDWISDILLPSPAQLNQVLQVGITSGNEEDQEEFIQKCQGTVWKCLQRDQARLAFVSL